MLAAIYAAQKIRIMDKKELKYFIFSIALCAALYFFSFESKDNGLPWKNNVCEQCDTAGYDWNNEERLKQIDNKYGNTTEKNTFHEVIRGNE